MIKALLGYYVHHNTHKNQVMQCNSHHGDFVDYTLQILLGFLQVGIVQTVF